MQDYQKLYAYHEKRDGQYELKSYWTSSQTVEFDDGDTLEEYKTALSSDIDSKGDEIDYSLDDGEIYLYSNGRKIATEEMSIRVAPNIQLDDISNLSIRLYQGNVRFTWTDPSDVIFSELPLVEWDGTKVVRKVGSAPNSVNDGTLVLDSKVRDAYSSTPYYDNNLTSGNYYYYRFFPYDKEGKYYGRTCGEVYKPIVLIPTGIPYLTETYTYTGSNITPNFVNYDTNTMTRSGTVYAKNAGTYTTTFTLKEGYKWSDNTTQPKEVTWSIGKADGFIQVSESSITMKNQSSYTIDITGSSNTVTVQSFDSSIIGVEIESNEITISCDLLSDTSTTFTLSVAENSNYLSTTIVIEVIIKNKLVDTWLAKTWNGYTSIYGNYTWLDGNNVYYSQGKNQYVLDKSTSTWNAKTWNGYPQFNADCIWSDGENIYYSFSTFQYVLDKATSTWNTKTWNGYSQIGGNNIWTDGENIYWSYKGNQYVLDKSTSTWNTKTWNGLSNFIGAYIWSDGENVYYSYDTSQYVLDKATSTWTTKTWSGEQITYGNYIWTDGENIYFSDGSAHQYILDKTTSTWNTKTWKGWPSTTRPNGDFIWTDGENVYASYTYQYVLDK